MKPVKSFKIRELVIEYYILHRKVKYPRLEIKGDLLYVIVPDNYDNADDLIKKHESWIYNKLCQRKRLKEESQTLELNLKLQDNEFKEMVFYMVENISRELDVEVNQVRFRRMKSRWGSCSSKGNLNFNYYLKFLPENLIEYIVYHELSHLIVMGHNKRFWNIISKRYPLYKEIEDELLAYWLKLKEYLDIK
jgi:predicted metal-dependent hydrolase